MGRRDYQERKASRLDRLEARGNKLRAESASRLAAADRVASAIPLGQPILVGHHSERRHRRDIERINANMRKGVDAGREAERIERARDAAEGNSAISSDDPDAVVRLKEKLARLEAEQDTMRRVNALIRKHTKKGPAATELELLRFGIDQRTASVLLKGDSLGRLGYADYRLKNNGAEIRRCKQRIAVLQRAAALPEVHEEIGKVRLEVADNRVQLHFPGKPSAELRCELKRAGFRWAPSSGAWQRQPSQYAIQEARRLAAKAGGTA